MSNNQFIINLVGAPGAGKSFAAKVLAEEMGFTHLSYASALRKELIEFLSRPNECRVFQGAEVQHMSTETFGELVALCDTLRPDDIYAKQKSPAARRALQLWGTEFRRAQDPDYWFQQLQDQVKGKVLLCNQRNFVIDDSRFANEFNWNSGPIFYIYNEQAERDAKFSGVNNHSSENLRQIIRVISWYDEPKFMGRPIYCLTNTKDTGFKSALRVTVKKIQEDASSQL